MPISATSRKTPAMASPPKTAPSCTDSHAYPVTHRKTNTTNTAQAAIAGAAHVVEQDRRVRQHDALDARVRDVALVPQGDVLERRVGVAAEHAGEARDALAGDRVALVRHRR